MKIDMPEVVLEGMRTCYHKSHDSYISREFIKALPKEAKRSDNNIGHVIDGDIHIHQYINKSLPLIDKNEDVYRHLCMLNKVIEKSTFGKTHMHSLVNVDFDSMLGYVRGYVEFWSKIFA